MSNVFDNDLTDRKLDRSELDGLTVTLSVEDCSRLYALLGNCSSDSGLNELYDELSRHLDGWDEASDYNVLTSPVEIWIVPNA